MTEHQPNIREFFRAIWQNWGPLMSGAFSVPFAMATVFVDTKYGQAIWVAMAIIALLFTSYLIWSKERATVVELRERIRPKLKCTFNNDDPGCVRPNVVSDIPVGPDRTVRKTGTWYRAKVEADGPDHVTNCRGRLNSIKRDGQIVFAGEPVVLPFVQLEQPTTSKQVNAGAPEYLDVLFASNDGEVITVTPRHFVFPASIDHNAWFSQPGEYVLDIVVLSEGPPVPLALTVIRKEDGLPAISRS